MFAMGDAGPRARQPGRVRCPAPSGGVGKGDFARVIMPATFFARQPTPAMNMPASDLANS